MPGFLRNSMEYVRAMGSRRFKPGCESDWAHFTGPGSEGFEGKLSRVRIFNVDVEKRTCTVKGFNGATFPDVPWASVFMNFKNGAGDDYIPNEGGLYIAGMMNNQPVILAAMPVLDEYGTYKGQRLDNLNPGDRVISANETTRTEWRSSGIIKSMVSGFCSRIMSSVRHQILDTCLNYIMNTAGGNIQWILSEDDNKSTNFKATFRKSIKQTDVAVTISMGNDPDSLEVIVQGDATIRVTRDADIQVMRDAFVEIQHNAEIDVWNNCDITVGIKAGLPEFPTYIGNANIFIQHNATVEVGNNCDISVGTKVGDPLFPAYVGDASVFVRRNASIEVGNNCDIQVGTLVGPSNPSYIGDATIDVHRDATVHVGRNSYIETEEDTEIVSHKNIKLHADESIEIRSNTITVEAVSNGSTPTNQGSHGTINSQPTLNLNVNGTSGGHVSNLNLSVVTNCANGSGHANINQSVFDAANSCPVNLPANGSTLTDDAPCPP